MTNDLPPSDIAEKRGCYRIDDMMEIYARPATNNEIENPVYILDTDERVMNVTYLLHEVDNEIAPIEHEILKKFPLLGKYLAGLNKKISIIADKINDSEEVEEEFILSPVNISESGLAYPDDKAYEKGTLLRIRLVLHPDLINIICYGEVVYSRQFDDEITKKQFRIGVKFAKMSGQDKQIIGKYIFKKQLQENNSDGL